MIFRPYSTHRLQRYRNNQDCFYNREGGKLTLMNAQPINGMNIKDGLRAHLSMRLDTRNNLFGNETPSNCLYIDF